MNALPSNAPTAVVTALTALATQGYQFDRLVRHPAYREPLARVYLVGPPWVMVLIGIMWLVAYGLGRLPLTRNIGAALMAHGAVTQPIMYVDAAGVAH